MENNSKINMDTIMLNINDNNKNEENKDIKYTIEDNIDFYSQINNNIIESNLDNTCLITGEPLVKHNQTLQCGHMFNYVPLYVYVKKSKYKFNYLEHTPLKITQIKCPYCRNVQNELLPYIEEFNFPKIPGVNHLDEQYKSFLGRCEYVTSKKVQCMSNRVYLLNERCYCYTHRNIVIYREHKKAQLYKLKIGNKKEPIKYKVITEYKNDKSDTILDNVDNNTDNTTDDNTTDDKKDDNNNITINKCAYIFVKGIKKNCYCNIKISNINEIYCKKHKK